MTAGTVEKIQVVLQAVTAGFAKGLNRAQAQMKGVGKNMQNFGAVMQMPIQNFKELNNRMGVMQGVGGRVAKRFRMMTHGMRGFRMEALGVMFFGMMMQKMFMGLLQPVMDAFGVFDLFRVMLLVLFLPVMEMIFPYFLAMTEWFMNLPEPVKKAIGVFVILGAILGTIIMVLGQFALGIGSLILMFPGLGAAIKLVGIFLIGLSGTALAVVAVILAVFVGMFLAWKNNFLNMKKTVKNVLDGIKQFFSGHFNIIKGIIKVILGIITLDFEKFKEGIKMIVMGIKDVIVGMFKTTTNAVIAIFTGALKIIMEIMDKVLAAGALIGNVISGKGFTTEGALQLGPKKDDFIWRPGQSPISINPNDTLVGFKGAPPNLGGGEGGVVQNNNYYGFTMDDLKRELDDRDRRLIDEIRRQTK